MNLSAIDIMSAGGYKIVAGIFIGAIIPYFFAGATMMAVGRAAFNVVEEVRRQFREIPGLMSGKGKPDYAKCVDISTKTALGELAIPGILAVVSPLLIGLLLGPIALGGFLAGVIASGLMVAFFMCTAGGAWDNGKKLIQGIYGYGEKLKGKVQVVFLPGYNMDTALKLVSPGCR